jgi:hypothetical protein
LNIFHIQQFSQCMKSTTQTQSIAQNYIIKYVYSFYFHNWGFVHSSEHLSHSSLFSLQELIYTNSVNWSDSIIKNVYSFNYFQSKLNSFFWTPSHSALFSMHEVNNTNSVNWSDSIIKNVYSFNYFQLKLCSFFWAFFTFTTFLTARTNSHKLSQLLQNRL